MHSRKFVFQQAGTVALGQLVCTAVMTGVFALTSYFDLSVLLGGIAGAVLATANFFFMALFADMAADKAAHREAAAGQKLLRLSYMGRMAVLLVVLVLCAKTEFFHPLALVIPLAFTRPILTLAALIERKGGKES